MAEIRQRPLHELLSRDMVDIYVGPENTHWILHEKLLCHHSRFFRNIFDNHDGSRNQTFGLPDEDDEPFRLFVGWLYSEAVPPPQAEKDLTPLLDLYLMGEKWEIHGLVVDVLEIVRKWYRNTDTWPGLRRVQYIYSNTKSGSFLRQLLVECVARMLVLGDTIPEHWQNALKRNGELGLDIILCVQTWRIDPANVPDAREENADSIEEDAEQKEEIKREEGVSESGHDWELTNGVNGVSGDEDEDKY